MVQGTPVGFCFILNWMGGPSSVERAPEFIAAIAKVLNHAISALTH